MLKEFRSIDVYWDKATRRIYEEIRTSSSDEKGRKLTVQVVNDGQTQDLTNAALNLYWETQYGVSRGLDPFEPLDAENGIYELYFRTGMLKHVGKLNAHLHLVDTTGAITSEQFTISVFQGIDVDAMASDDELSSLNKALIEVQNIKQDETERVANEQLRVSAEAERIRAEEERVSNENERKTAETARNTNETTRVSNETDRVNAEDTRNTNETNRVDAETSRVTAESARVTAEEEREATVTELSQTVHNLNLAQSEWGDYSDGRFKRLPSSGVNFYKNDELLSRYFPNVSGMCSYIMPILDGSYRLLIGLEYADGQYGQQLELRHNGLWTRNKTNGTWGAWRSL